MGVAFSCPFAKCSDVENGLESITVKSISFGDDGVRTPVRSISFKSLDSEPTIFRSVGSGKMILEGSVSFNKRHLERKLSVKSSSLDKADNFPIKAASLKSETTDIESPKPDTSIETPEQSPVLDPAHPQHDAAIRLQKVYKSFRTRRKLADCAVLVEQSWFVLDDGVRTPVRSISFKSLDSEPTIFKSVGSGKMVLEGSVSFNGRHLERKLSVKSSSSDKADNFPIKAASLKSEMTDIESPKPDTSIEIPEQSPVLDPTYPQHDAAIRLQKVYKSFRTRRKLADCAVLVEQSRWKLIDFSEPKRSSISFLDIDKHETAISCWSKLLDFAELKRSSISFFDIDKHETAISRWSRARTRAAKVGKGLSKNDKAQKLALQHWLEAIDPRHRYGHNLHFYYNQWLHSLSQEPFFYWLDIGEGKEVNIEKCPRSKLQQQCIKYLGPMERKPYEVIVVDGKFKYKQTGKLLHTTKGTGDAKWIFVLSTSKILYVGIKKKGTFQHSSFLAGGATIAAGRLLVDSGVLKAVWPHSGHYRPTEENFNDLILFLKENNVDLTDVKLSPVEEEGILFGKQRSSKHLRCNSSEEDFNLEAEEISVEDSIEKVVDSSGQETRAVLERPKSRRCLSGKLTNLEIPKRMEVFEMSNGDNGAVVPSCNDNSMDSPLEDVYETEEEAIASKLDSMVPKEKVDENHVDNEVEDIPEESILQRLNSKKGMNSYQLGKQLSCKWSTGAGPRIGCVRDSPSELQFRALEQVNLSPRSAMSPKVSAAAGASQEMRSLSLPVLKKENLLHRSIHYRMQSSPILRG